MSKLLHHLLMDSASKFGNKDALISHNKTFSYETLSLITNDLCEKFLSLGLKKQERVAIYLPKCVESVTSMFATSQAGGVFVPINPLLKSDQVKHILNDCNVRILVTSSDRAKILSDSLTECNELHNVIITGEEANEPLQLKNSSQNICHMSQLQKTAETISPHRVIDTDMAGIFYTSGSTGKPKGVVLSHNNMMSGAASVKEYLDNDQSDHLLAVLPFSFDYGFSQLSTAFLSGACVSILDYFLPKDVINYLSEHKITGLAGVPSLWIALSKMNWPNSVTSNLRYITNSGGAMPQAVLEKLQIALPDTNIYLMYGLTEAFRSTYLPPDQISIRPTSIGKAIPNAEISVVRSDGSLCEVDEPGELVHRGSLVAQGYWNDELKTEKRFRPAPNQPTGIKIPEIAVWSGDIVKTDNEGYLYFVGRNDEMIKSSGYRISPTEVEEVIYSSEIVSEVCIIGAPHPSFGQALVAIVSAKSNENNSDTELLNHCKNHLPNFMLPAKFVWVEKLPKNQNGKFDRKTLSNQFANLFNSE